MTTDTSPAPLIELRGITRTYLTEDVETRALSDVNLKIHAGEYLAICGPSGCGKSTLLAILGLLETPSTGSYTIKGQAAQSLSAAERTRLRNQEIGFIFQAFNLIGDLSVLENVELPLTYRDGMAKAERRQRATDALQRVGLDHRLGHYPAQLSGGQQQRVAVARALAGSPALLLADEPTGNLDTANGRAVMQLLDDLHKGGAAIVMVTHDPQHAALASRQIHLMDGRVADPP